MKVLVELVAVVARGIHPSGLLKVNAGDGGEVIQTCFATVVVPHGFVEDNVTVYVPGVV